jgi:hypothetical protein
MNGQEPPLKQSTLLLWESDLTAAGDGRMIVTARRLVTDCTVERARKILGLPKSRTAVVYRLYRAGLIDGAKPGAIAKRKDGRSSNAKLVLDMESVLRYHESTRSKRA